MKPLLYFIALSSIGALIDCTRLSKPVSNLQLKKSEGITIVKNTTSLANNTSIVVSTDQVCNNDEKVTAANNLSGNTELKSEGVFVPKNNPKGENPQPVLNGKPKTIYSIQLLAVIFPHPLTSPIFKGRKVKEEYSDADHLFRYSTGNFKSKEKALRETKKIHSDFPGAFITATLNGKKVPVIGMEIIARSEMEPK